MSYNNQLKVYLRTSSEALLYAVDDDVAGTVANLVYKAGTHAAWFRHRDGAVALHKDAVAMVEISGPFLEKTP